ncbi:hypothetical protein CI109_101429 [Kwoniella shandongensis]|uniref:Uncharacterized protein n=1 Tax=Kwoniella shandongensis TaxID=1734106 RepID=A0A5M6C013_9TREE|nr:uncharacterized protein CI109_005125 [Kwoniella shandongensis]KAA5526549.1 hypothetical protein CI109_005125 [Kwoniella shandongensis]
MSKQLALWEAEERKLQSVYDDISSHRLAPASSTLNRYLKKHPKSQPALILKMYILQKTSPSSSNTEDEVMKLFREVKGLAVTSNGGKKEGEQGGFVMTGRGVWWCALTLRNMGRLDLAQQLYESLYASHPDALPLLEQVYLHAAAADDVEALVKSSRQLFNKTRETRWARAAGWAEWVQKAPQPTPDQSYPPLAPKNTLKIAQTLLSTTGKTCETSEILWLRIQVLLSSGEYAEVLKLAREEGAKGSLARVWWRMEGIKETLRRMAEDGVEGLEEEWKTERAWVEGVLSEDTESQRNYAHYRYLLEATEKSGFSAIDETNALLVDLQDKVGSKERAPALALIELRCRSRTKSEKTTETANDIDDVEKVQEYWIRWGSKGSIITEIEGIWGDGERKEKIVEFLKQQAARRHTDEQSYREQVNASIIMLRDRDAEWVPSLEDIERYWTLYREGLQYGKNLPKTDVQPADQIGLVAVSLLIELWHRSPSDLTPLYRAIISLEYISKQSPANLHAHYLLIRLYRLIGAFSLVPSHLSALKLSEIQLDNMFHVVLERSGGESVVGDNQEVWMGHVKKASDMYKRTDLDFPEYVKECLSNETYSKIPSIRYLKVSLSTSLSFRILSIEKARYALHIGAGISDSLLALLDRAVREKSVDLRNWEMIAEIGGKRPFTRELTSLTEEALRGEWTTAMAALMANVVRFTNGEPVTGQILWDQMLDCEEALVRNAMRLLRAASRALDAAPADDTTADGDDGDDIKGLFDENIKQCLADHPSRWTQIQAFITLHELIKISDLVLTRLVDASKPVKGKKKPAGLSDFVTTLKGIKDGLDLKILQERLGQLEEDSGLDDEAIGGKWVDDGKFLKERINAIERSRKDALKGVRTLLGSSTNGGKKK